MSIDVLCQDGTIQIARIIETLENSYLIKFIIKNELNFYNFNEHTEEISKDDVQGFYDTDNLEETNLFIKTQLGYEFVDDSEDENYECTESDDEESEDDISLVDENESEDEIDT